MVALAAMDQHLLTFIVVQGCLNLVLIVWLASVHLKCTLLQADMLCNYEICQDHHKHAVSLATTSKVHHTRVVMDDAPTPPDV